MLINHFDPATGEFISQTVARRDPLNPSKYLLPLYAVFNDKASLPTIGANQTAVFDGLVFNVVDDYREAETYYDKVTGNKIVFKLGEKPNSIMSTTFPAAIQQQIDDQTAATQRKSVRDALLNRLTHDFLDGRIMQTRPRDESNIRNAIEVMTSQSLSTINWVMADNTKKPVSSAELKTALQAGQLAALNIWNNYVP